MIIIDFETRSLADLATVGGRNYAEHPTTDVICCCAIDVDKGEVLAPWIAGDPEPDWSPSLRVAAHNADGFDTHIWRRLGWPEPKQWIDTAALARASGLPGKLEEIAARYGEGFRKDLTGNAITLALSDTKLPPSRKDKHTGAPVVAIPDEIKAALRGYHKALKAEFDAPRCGDWPAIPPIVLEAVVRYCAMDVAVTAGVVWPLVADFADLEPRALEAWRAANDRGILFDADLARALLAADEAVSAAALAAAGVEAVDVRSPKRFAERMHMLGAPIPNAQYDTVEPLTRHADPRVAALARARLALASIARGKLTAGLARVSADGRMRDNVRYFGAHTGRGAGGGMQLQNIPHPDGIGADGSKVKKWDDARVCAEAVAPRLWNQAEISMLLRACVMAPPGMVLVAADFSGVEARANAWAAGDEPALALFRSGADAYAPLACNLFGCVAAPHPLTAKALYEAWKTEHFSERDTAKKAELGCGYQMGAPKFTLTAEKGGMVWRDPSECAELRGGECVDPICGKVEGAYTEAHTHGAKTIVTTWRALHRPIVDFWYALEAASVQAVDGRTHVPVECCIDLAFDFVGRDLALVLPSGRPVVYREARIVDGKYGPQVRFIGARGPAHLYGGLLCENAIQATCREFLVNGMINAEDAGLPVVLTVHDEIVSEAPAHLASEALAALEECMTTLPAWGAGMPIAVEGFIARRYRK